MKVFLQGCNLATSFYAETESAYQKNVTVPSKAYFFDRSRPGKNVWCGYKLYNIQGGPKSKPLL